VRRALSAIGRTLVTAGILILLFVAYQLWGTGIYQAREQSRLQDEFTSQLREHGAQPDTTTTTTTTGTTVTSTPSSTTTSTTQPAPPPPPEGESVARLRIPRISVDSIVVQGVTREDLRRGPGHYPISPMPGQVGNAAIAGHRTTYGAPFHNIDQLERGDIIFVRTVQGSFRYRVYEQRVVSPSDVHVLDPDPARRATLTLTTCNPKYSAAQRLIVKAELTRAPLPAPLTGPVRLSDEGLSGEESSRVPTIISGLIAAAIGALWWLFFHRHPRWTTWFLGAVPFLVALFVFYTYLERVLPSNY
jgi:sortase A